VSQAIRALIIPCGALALAACSTPRGPFPAAETIGWSVEGRPVEALVFPGKGPPVLVIGGIHGDETAGAVLVEELGRSLAAYGGGPAEERAAVLIPKANPDGLVAGTRTNSRGVDINRNFATRSFRPGGGHGPGPESEPETRAILEALARYRPSTVIAVHGPLACVDPDGGEESQCLARRILEESPLPLKDLSPHPGSLGTLAGIEMCLAMVTYELDRKRLPGTGRRAYLDPHVRALLAALQSSQRLNLQSRSSGVGSMPQPGWGIAGAGPPRKR
jgi:protein MpaA